MDIGYTPRRRSSLNLPSVGKIAKNVNLSENLNAFKTFHKKKLPSGQNRRKSSLCKCIFDNMALYFECRINAILHTGNVSYVNFFFYFRSAEREFQGFEDFGKTRVNIYNDGSCVWLMPVILRYVK